jgi:hypothetical protein
VAGGPTLAAGAAGQEDKAGPAFAMARFVAHGTNRSLPLEAMPGIMAAMNVRDYRA